MFCFILESASSRAGGSWLETSSVYSHLQTPVLTSTVQKQTANEAAFKKPVDALSHIGSDVPEPESEEEFSQQ